MKILTNLKSLRNSTEYLSNININFNYIPIGVFGLCEYRPDVIISDNYHEIITASKDYPDIIFMGKDLGFPNIPYSVPKALLDELTVLSQPENVFRECFISYFNESGEENKVFIDKIRNLGNVKIMGPGFCVDELDKAYPIRLTPSFYQYSKVVAATSKEESLKALFMGKPCIFNGVSPKTYNINKLSSTNFIPFENQVDYAWKFSHTEVWADILINLGHPDKAYELKQIINLEKE